MKHLQPPPVREQRPDDADVAPQLSMSPAYSMLPWDKPANWPAVGDSMHGMGSLASVQPSTAASDSSVMASAAPRAPVAFTHQPSRLSMTAAGSMQQPSPPKGMIPQARPFSLWTMHQNRQHVHALETASAERHQQDDISSWADLPGTMRSPYAIWHRDPSAAPLVTASMEYGQEGGTTAQADTLSTVHHKGADPPGHSSAESYQEHTHTHLSEKDLGANVLSHMPGHLKDQHVAFPAQGSPAGQMLGQGPGHSHLLESVDQAMAWGGSSHDDGSPDAKMQRSHHWLSMHGYSNATVHVTATWAEALSPPSTAESGGKHAKGLSSPVKAPLPTSQMLADSLPGAIKHSAAPPSLKISSSSTQVRSAIDAGSAWQADANLVRPGTPSSGDKPCHQSIWASSNFCADTCQYAGCSSEQDNSIHMGS